MSKYIPAKKLIEYIKSRRDSALERQKNLEKIGQETVLNEMIAFELNRLISFVASLQQEQPKVDLEKELEEEIERFYRTDEYRIADTLGRGFETLARHFAEWGRKQVLQEIYDGKVKPVDKITAAWLDDESKAKEDK